MRQDGERRGDMPVWSIAPGDRVFSDTNSGTGPWSGTVVAVGKDTIEIHWSDGMFSVTYPKDALGIRKPFPWE